MKSNLSKQIPLLLVLILSLFFRAYRLGDLPSVINGDEGGSLVHPLQILYMPKLSLFTLTHDNSVSYLIYLPKALALMLFGESQILFLIRFVTALVSIGTLAGFYLTVRKYVTTPVAFFTTLLLSSNIIFLSFSRVSWINMDSVFFSVWLFYFLDNYKSKYLIPLVLCSTALLHEYMGGRLFLLILPVFFLFYAVKNKSLVPLTHLTVIVVTTFLLFLPQLKVIIGNTEPYFRRASSVLMFPSPTHQPMSTAIVNQLSTIFRGLFIFDPSVGRLSVENRRLLPPNTFALSPVLVPFYLIGLSLVVLGKQARRLWLAPLFINLMIIQFPTTPIPSWGRALPIFPVIFFFIAISINTLLKLLKQSHVVKLCFAVATSIVFTANINGYFTWLNKPEYKQVHEPVIQLSDFPIWINLQKNYAITGKFPFDAYHWKNNLLPSIKRH